MESGVERRLDYCEQRVRLKSLETDELLTPNELSMREFGNSARFLTMGAETWKIKP